MNKIDSSVSFGIGYRHEIKDWIFANKNKIDCVEIIAESYFHYKNFDELQELCNHFKVIMHGVELSLGSTHIDEHHLRAVKSLLDITNCTYFGEHLSITNFQGLSFGHLTPVWYTEENLKIVSENIKMAQDYLKTTIVLENIFYLFEIPNNSMSEEEFFCRLIEITGCRLLLDLANVTANAHNHHFNPYTYIDAMPLQKLVQIHLAGGSITNDQLIIDSHNNLVAEDTWNLLRYLKSKTPVENVILEYDKDFPEDLDVLMHQLDLARNIF